MADKLSISLPGLFLGFLKRDEEKNFQGHEVPPPSDCPYFDCSTVVWQPDSHLIYAKHRAQGPVLYDPSFKCWVVSGHPEVTEALKRDDLFCNAHAQGFNKYLFSVDESVRKESKRCMRSVLSVEKEGVERFVEQWMDGFLNGQKLIDAVSDFGVPLPIGFTADMLGLNDTELQRIVRKLTGLRTDLGASLASVEKVIGEMLWEVRANPRDGVFSHLVQRAPESGMTDHQIVIMVRHLWYGATATLSTLLPATILWLCRRPDIAQDLRIDPSQIPNFISEVMRLETPVQFVPRICVTDFEYHGRRFTRGSLVRFCLASANRDPRVFPNPDTFDLDRPAYRNLALGYGEHFCLGGMQAKVIAETSIRRLLSASHFIRALTPEGNLRYEESQVFRGLKRLDVVLD